MRDFAIQPSESIRLDDGREFTLRALRPDDLDALRRAFLRLTPDEIENRFFFRSRELPASVQAQIAAFDPARETVFVVEDAGEIRAVADLHPDREGDAAEFGLIVGKRVSGHGLGWLLMQRLLAEAKRRGIASVYGSVRADNARMLQLCRELGAHTAPDAGDRTTLIVRFAQ